MHVRLGLRWSVRLGRTLGAFEGDDVEGEAGEDTVSMTGKIASSLVHARISLSLIGLWEYPQVIRPIA